jgi:predicted acylesterase/phospholipase RssA
MTPEQPPKLPRAFSPAHITYDVFKDELDEIIASRDSRGIDAGPLKDEQEDLKDVKNRDCCRRNGGEVPAVIPRECGLVGLALSGGGIRSASVCLGVLQALAEKDHLRFVDYLSTVSGGGYIGSCWSALLARSKDRRAGYKSTRSESRRCCCGALSSTP